jgi:phospholipase/carboxylesterase
MNARFSPELFARTEPSDEGGAIVAESLLPELFPLAGCQELVPAVVSARADDSSEEEDDVYVPEHYEHNYAYPLIVWLYPPASAPRQWRRSMKCISERNYVGVSIPIGDYEETASQVFATVARVRKRFHLHTERVYLVGFNDAGTRAVELGLSRPGWFGGIAAVSAGFPKIARPLSRYEELRGKRVFLALTERDGAALAGEVRRAQRLLFSAGMRVTCCTAAADDRHAGLLREIDRWIMGDIEQPELVC